MWPSTRDFPKCLMAASKRCTRRFLAAFWRSAIATITWMRFRRTRHRADGFDRRESVSLRRHGVPTRCDSCRNVSNRLTSAVPSLVRAAAKNHGDVAVATSPEQYGEILEQLDDAAGRRFGISSRNWPPMRLITPPNTTARSPIFARRYHWRFDFPTSMNLSLQA